MPPSGSWVNYTLDFAYFRLNAINLVLFWCDHHHTSCLMLIICYQCYIMFICFLWLSYVDHSCHSATVDVLVAAPPTSHELYHLFWLRAPGGGGWAGCFSTSLHIRFNNSQIQQQHHHLTRKYQFYYISLPTWRAVPLLLHEPHWHPLFDRD